MSAGGSADLSTVRFEDLVEEMIRRLGDDPERDGMKRTPERVAKAMAFLTKGYGETPEAVLGEAMFDESHRSMVVVKDIELYSLCEHHLLPFFGKAHVAYIPNGRVMGLSKVARLVEVYARRFQIQEDLEFDAHRRGGQGWNQREEPKNQEEAEPLGARQRSAHGENPSARTYIETGGKVHPSLPATGTAPRWDSSVVADQMVPIRLVTDRQRRPVPGPNGLEHTG